MNKKSWLVIGVIVLIIGVVVIYIGGALIILNDPQMGVETRLKYVERYSNENSSLLITRNNMQTSASIKMELFVGDEDFPNMDLFYLDHPTLLGDFFCLHIRDVFFNETTVGRVNKTIEEFSIPGFVSWSSMEGVIETEEGEKIGIPKEISPRYLSFERYEVIKFNFYLKDKQTKNILSECEITGPSDDELKFKSNGTIINYR